jgi:hypothetical protein
MDSLVGAERVKPPQAVEHEHGWMDDTGAGNDKVRVMAIEAAAVAEAEAAEMELRRMAAVEQQARVAAAAASAAAAAATAASAAAAANTKAAEQRIAAEMASAIEIEEETAAATQDARMLEKLRNGEETEHFEREPLLRPPEEPVLRRRHPERTIGVLNELPPTDPPGIDRTTAKLALSAPLRAPREEVAAGERVACKGGVWALVAAAGAGDGGAALVAALEEQDRLHGMDFIGICLSRDACHHRPSPLDNSVLEGTVRGGGGSCRIMSDFVHVVSNPRVLKYQCGRVNAGERAWRILSATSHISYQSLMILSECQPVTWRAYNLRWALAWGAAPG